MAKNGNEDRTCPLNETLTHVPRMALLIHHPSILNGARSAFNHSDIPVLEIGQILLDRTSHLNNRFHRVFNEIHMKVYIETPKRGSRHGDLLQSEEMKWRNDFPLPSNEENEKSFDVIRARHRAKGLAIKLSLDLIRIEESGQHDIAVVMAMDREIAPAIEYLINKYRSGQSGLEIETASWNRPIALVGEDYRRDVQHHVISKNDYYEARESYLSRHQKSKEEPDSEGWTQIVEEAVRMTQGIDGWALASEVGNWLKENKPRFDSHKYGRKTVYRLVKMRPDKFTIRSDPPSIRC